MITRGLLFDVAAAMGGPHLNPGRTVTPDDLKRAADTGGFAVQSGDIALIRTGWGRYFGVDNARYLQGEPGIDVPGARWLIDQGIVAIGADNMAVEVLPNPDHGLAVPVHQFALSQCGVYLIENLHWRRWPRIGFSSRASSCSRPSSVVRRVPRCGPWQWCNTSGRG